MAVRSETWALKRINSSARDVHHLLVNRPTQIGRNTQADIIIKSKFCSKNHCSIFIKGNRIFVEDTVRLPPHMLWCKSFDNVVSFHFSQATEHLSTTFRSKNVHENCATKM